jgi:N-methylhydantoinase B
VEAITNASQNLSNMPVEVLEAEHPVRVEEYAFVPDSCGPGRWRGGVGIRRSYRILAPEALLQLRSDRVAFRPYGLEGGGEGGASRNTIEVNGDVRPIPAKVTMSVQQGALIVHEQAGAGGFGDPFDREMQLILDDIKDGKITPAFAKDRHGVMLTDEGAIDESASAQRREDRSRGRLA